MILTTKSRYAVIAMIEMLEISSVKPVSLNKIADKQNISLSYLEQIFSKLKKANIIRSIKGPGGGYMLVKKSDEINVLDIIDVMSEKIKITRCYDSTDCPTDDKSRKCKTHKLWKNLENRIKSYLESTSLKDILDNKIIVK